MRQKIFAVSLARAIRSRNFVHVDGDGFEFALPLNNGSRVLSLSLSPLSSLSPSRRQHTIPTHNLSGPGSPDLAGMLAIPVVEFSAKLSLLTSTHTYTRSLTPRKRWTSSVIAGDITRYFRDTWKSAMRRTLDAESRPRAFPYTLCLCVYLSCCAELKNDGVRARFGGPNNLLRAPNSRNECLLGRKTRSPSLSFFIIRE